MLKHIAYKACKECSSIVSLFSQVRRSAGWLAMGPRLGCVGPRRLWANTCGGCGGYPVMFTARTDRAKTAGSAGSKRKGKMNPQSDIGLRLKHRVQEATWFCPCTGHKEHATARCPAVLCAHQDFYLIAGVVVALLAIHKWEAWGGILLATKAVVVRLAESSLVCCPVRSMHLNACAVLCVPGIC